MPLGTEALTVYSSGNDGMIEIPKEIELMWPTDPVLAPVFLPQTPIVPPTSSLAPIDLSDKNLSIEDTTDKILTDPIMVQPDSEPRRMDKFPPINLSIQLPPQLATTQTVPKEVVKVISETPKIVEVRTESFEVLWKVFKFIGHLIFF